MIHNNLRFEELINYNGEKNDIYKLYENFTKDELEPCLILERQGIAAFKYNNVLTEILSYCQNYIENNNPQKFYNKFFEEDLLTIEEYEIVVPSEIVEKLDFAYEGVITILIKNILTHKAFKSKDVFGDGSVGHSMYDEIKNINGVEKMTNLNVNITSYSINNKIIRNTLMEPLYHEINHAMDNYNRLLNFYKGKTIEYGLYDNLKKINYVDKRNLFKSNDNIDKMVGFIVYHLWIETERNSFATGLYAYLKSIKSTRNNFIKDFHNSQSYVIYKNLKNYIEKLKDVNDINRWKRYIVIIHPTYKGDVLNFKENFIKRSNILLNNFFKKLIKNASLYYIESEEMNDKENNTINTQR